jgi:WD40 repeat protein
MAVKLTRLKLFLLVAATTALVMVVALVDLKRSVLTAREILVLERQTGDSEATFAAFSPDGTRLAVGGHGHARVWDLASRKPLVSFDTWDENIALSPDGTRLAAVGRDKDTLQLWDAATGKELRTMASPRDPDICRAAGQHMVRISLPKHAVRPRFSYAEEAVGHMSGR